MARASGLMIIGALGLAACATAYEDRIRSNLMRAGLSRSVSSCVADRMTDQLSTRQLHSLAALGTRRDRQVRDMTVAQFLREHRAMLDPEVYAVMTRVGLGCAIAG